jgi:hypothetical protein
MTPSFASAPAPSSGRPPLSIAELVHGAAADAGVEPDKAWPALTGALGLIDKHATPETAAEVYAAIEGAEDLATSEEARPRAGGGLFGGLMKGAGGLSGAAVADAMGLLDRLKRQGVDKAALKRLLPAARARVEAAAGRDVLGAAVKSIPGVGPLLGSS